MRKYILSILIVIFAISLFSQEASSKSYQSANNSSAYFYSGSMSGSDQLKIYTYIWGQVRKPGMYIVPDNTDLLALLSLAGGPTENAKLTKVRIVRPTAVGEKIIWIDLKEYLETGKEEMIPTAKSKNSS